MFLVRILLLYSHRANIAFLIRQYRDFFVVCLHYLFHANMLSQCLDINGCEAKPCQHGATCVDTAGNYTCACASGYTGRNCNEGNL